MVPRFPLDVCDETFNRVEQYLRGLSYSGPVALSCDDTQLHPAYRTFWDPSKEAHVLVGGTDGPMVIANPEELEELIKDSNRRKATKVRFHSCTLRVRITY